MAEFKGTPGPWKWESEYFGLRQKTEAGGAWILKPEPWEGMHMAYPSETRAANARLLASSPVLLEALQAAIASFDEWAEDADPSSLADAQARLPWVDQARAAISLALGE